MKKRFLVSSMAMLSMLVPLTAVNAQEQEPGFSSGQGPGPGQGPGQGFRTEQGPGPGVNVPSGQGSQFRIVCLRRSSKL